MRCLGHTSLLKSPLYKGDLEDLVRYRPKNAKDFEKWLTVDGNRLCILLQPQGEEGIVDHVCVLVLSDEIFV